MSKVDKFLVNVYGVIQLGCIMGLAGIAFKRNNDAYKASCKLIESEIKHIEKDIEIYNLQCEVRQLKEKKYEPVDEEA